MNKKWSDIEEKLLVELLKQNKTIKEIAKEHGRTEGAIKARQQLIAMELYNNNNTIEEIMNITKLSEKEINNYILKKELKEQAMNKINTEKESQYNKNKSNNNNLTIYILSCENNKYYVGKTKDLDFRLENHFDGSGSAWTALYKPIKLIELYENCDSYDEDKYTLKMMEKHGVNNVRGGSFSQIDLDKNQQELIAKMIKSANDKCYLCGKKDHFINNCPDKQNNTFLTNLLGKEGEKIINNIVDTVLNIFSSNDNCYRCGREGHYSRDCFAKTHVNGYYLYDDNDSSDNSSTDDKCYKCGKNGHYAKDCYVKKKSYYKKRK